MMYYRLVRWIITILARILVQFEIVGSENVPLEGACIVTPNHLSWFDSPLMLIAVPRRITVLAANKYRCHPFFGPLLASMGAIWIHRGNVDRHALRQATEVLRSDGCLGLAPEGTRSKTGSLQRGKTGAVYLASRSGAVFVPVAITGTEKIGDALRHFRRGKARIEIGKPIDLPFPERLRGEQLEEFIDTL
ncbi:MAG: lysophospholipid acyltransferase family protein, partial [Chloroflexota bacterium]|nr:lysophospholipid acyltransferase family protein [Chloroflexota bacterium]